MNGPSSGSQGVRAEGARAEDAGFGRAAGVALVAALLWGVWWIPVRDLEAAGLTGAWASVAINAGAAPIAAIGLLAWRDRTSFSPRVIAGAAFVGCAIALYGASVVLTDIVRAVLLFYLAPAWAIAIECVFMGRRLRASTLVALVLAALGAVAVFRGEVDLAGWGVGDGAAIASGMMWAIGAALLSAGPKFSPFKMSLAVFLAAATFSALFAVAVGTPPPTAAVVVEAAPLALLYGGLFFTPIIVATMWSAARLTPTLLSLLLAGEIISGVGSSALLLDEPFGLPEIIGALLIGVAATLEGLTSSKDAQTRRAVPSDASG